jgi:hypothetical protein
MFVLMLWLKEPIARASGNPSLAKPLSHMATDAVTGALQPTVVEQRIMDHRYGDHTKLDAFKQPEGVDRRFYGPSLAPWFNNPKGSQTVNRYCENEICILNSHKYVLTVRRSIGVLIVSTSNLTYVYPLGAFF